MFEVADYLHCPWLFNRCLLFSDWFSQFFVEIEERKFEVASDAFSTFRVSSSCMLLEVHIVHSMTKALRSI